MTSGQLQDQVQSITNFAPRYDSKTGVKGNGYRSFIRISGSFVAILAEKLIRITTAKSVSVAEAEELSFSLDFLRKLVELNDFVLEIQALKPDGDEIFPDMPDLKHVEEMALKMGKTDFSHFYGRYAGFHYRGDFKLLAKPLLHLMANFGDYYAPSFSAKLKRASAALFGIKYAADPDYMAKKIFKEIQEGQVDFCKTFYNMSEIGILYGKMTRFHSDRKVAHIKCNSVIKIPADKIRIMNTQGEKSF